MAPLSTEAYLVVLFGVAVCTALAARWTRLPITPLEIVAGILLVGFFSLKLPADATAFVSLGSLLIVFLAGFETNLSFLRQNFSRALTWGLTGFLVPFVGLLFLFDVVLQAPLLISLIAATALADTSISIVYTTLHQYDLAQLPIGRLILGVTLVVNLAEDFTITTTTFLTTPGFIFTLGVLAALLAAALLLPRLSKALAARRTDSFSNLTLRALLFSLVVLAALSALVGVPGILFVFLMGLIFSQFAGTEFIADARKFAFAVFVPLYFLAVGLRVDVGFVLAHLGLLLVIAAVASGLKLASIYPIARKNIGPVRAAPVAVLMNARLTSATVILLLTSTLGLLPIEWYSLLISAVVLLALGSSFALRFFPAFRSSGAAKATFATEALPEPSLGWGGNVGTGNPGSLEP